ncbi:MAG: hypothetical protein VX952_12995 [Pseudomonadota bacterium]|nr:hypothetical protein [Pseudomonadota bacterium]
MDPIWNPEYFTREEIQEFFKYFFSLPLIVYLVAWAYQTVINFATTDDN